MKRLLMAWLCAGFALAAVAQGDKAAGAAPAPGFKSSAALGVTLTQGNSETLQANASLKTESEKKGLGSVRAGIEGNYGESTVSDTKDTTVGNARFFAGGKKTFSRATFGSLDVSALYDKIADVDYRVTAAPGLGAYLIKREGAAWSVEAGPAHIWEEVSGVRDDYVALRFAERLDVALSATAKLWQSAEWLPQAGDFGDSLLIAEVGVEAAINSRLSLRLVLQDKYDSTPGEGLEKNDLSLIGGLGVTL